MKFIIADVSGYMTDILYHDIAGNSKYYIINKTSIYKNRWLNKLCLANISLKINRKLKMPLKKFFYHQIFGNFDDKDSLIFYFGIFWFDKDLFSYLKTKYPTAKFVFNLHDTVDSKIKIFDDFSIQYLKETFDLVYSYSEVDVTKYDLLYTPDMYSKFEIEKLPRYPQYDVVFIGAAKDRLKLILQMYKRLSDKGFSCWFYIVGAPDEEKEQKEGIIYSNSYLPFKEVIARQVAAKCLLEVTQAGCIDATLRFWDAVMYNKHIITNCEAVKKYDYYDPRYVHLFHNATDDSIDSMEINSNVQFNYKGDISPLTVFSKIESDLKKNEN